MLPLLVTWVAVLVVSVTEAVVLPVPVSVVPVPMDSVEEIERVSVTEPMTGVVVSEPVT
ncbi:hypothetical protein PC116_g32172 [Phytophthora cactorum]|nr:hypothetical protein PC116_g32172 [Phytophthora cactorum]